MSAAIRIPVTLHHGHDASVENIDLNAHLGVLGPVKPQGLSLRARDRKGRTLAVQCLTDAEPAHSTLLFENTDARELIIARNDEGPARQNGGIL